MTEEEIIKLCEHYKIENYKINPDMSIDVDGDVYLHGRKLTQLPVIFRNVTGNFDCGDNKIVSLKGYPNYIGGYFNCSANDLTTLNELPTNFYVGGDFWCSYNYFNEAKEYGRLFFGCVNGKIDTKFFDLDAFLNEHKNPPKKDLPKLLSELRKIKLQNNDFAE